MSTARNTTPGAPRLRRLAAAGAAVATLAFGAAACGGEEGGKEGGYTVRAIFDSAAFVSDGLDVRISGVRVGAVDSVSLTDDNRAAVTFTITKPGFQDLRKDARCTIRPQALIGERYIACELTQVRPDDATAPPAIPAIADGPYKGQHLLPLENTAVPIDPDQLLNVNTATVRERFGIIIRELGAGVAGRGDELASTLRKTNDGLRYANRILKQLDDQEDMLKQLVSSSDQTLASLAAERSAVSGTVENGAVVAQRLANRQAELQGTIASLNQLLDEVGPSVDKVDDLAEQLQPIADDLNRSSSDVATILNQLPELSDRGTEAVEALSPTLDRGREVLTSDTNNALFDRLVKTSGAVKASGSVLGLALGDFRSTGGLEYFLDALYGLAYSTNGRDESGHYLRAGLLNTTNCGVIPKSLAAACGRSRPAPAGSASSASASASGTATKASAAKQQAVTPAKTPSVEQAAADLLLGGTQ